MSNKTLNKILNSASGFSLTEVMVGGGILAGVALASAQLFKDQQMAQKQIDSTQKLHLYHQNLAKTMGMAANCNATLKQYVSNGAGTIPSQEINTLFTCNPSAGSCSDTNALALGGNFDAYTAGAFVGSPLVSKDSYVDSNETWKVNKITLGSRSNTGHLALTIDYGTNPKLGSSKQISKTILMNVRFGGGVFKECVNNQESNVNNLQKDLCKSLNLSEVASDGRMATWDEVNQKCLLNGSKDCSGIPGTMADGIDSNGQVKCRPILNTTNAADFEFNAAQPCTPPNKPKMFFDTVTKKMKIQCI